MVPATQLGIHNLVMDKVDGGWIPFQPIRKNIVEYCPECKDMQVLASLSGEQDALRVWDISQELSVHVLGQTWKKCVPFCEPEYKAEKTFTNRKCD